MRDGLAVFGTEDSLAELRDAGLKLIDEQPRSVLSGGAAEGFSVDADFDGVVDLDALEMLRWYFVPGAPIPEDPDICGCFDRSRLLR